MENKSIAIIGCGLSGLRAGMELALHQSLSLTLFDKSPSVGGRIATRRINESYINHGALQVDGWDRVLKIDPKANEFNQFFNKSQIFTGRATDLPKLMKEKIHHASFEFNTKITDLSPYFDYTIIAIPLPQAEELIKSRLNLNVTYSKKILLLSQNSRIELDESYFDKEDKDILAEFNHDKNLMIKRWRYSQVKNGFSESFYLFSPNIIITGDAFDDQNQFNAASAWISGLKAAQYIINKEKL